MELPILKSIATRLEHILLPPLQKKNGRTVLLPCMCVCARGVSIQAEVVEPGQCPEGVDGKPCWQIRGESTCVAKEGGAAAAD